MINLLPPDIKQQYYYGLRNAALRRWMAGLLLTIAGLGVIATYGLLTMQRSINSYSARVTTSKTELERQQLAQTEVQVKNMTNDFKLIVQVLSKQVLFSKLLKQMATIVPEGVSLSGLNITQSNSALDITASVLDSTTATQFQLNLEDPANKVFQKADIVSITCLSTTPGAYPCTAQYKALLAPNNPYLFINGSGSSKP